MQSRFLDVKQNLSTIAKLDVAWHLMVCLERGRRVYGHNKFHLCSFMLDYLWSPWFLVPKNWLGSITLKIAFTPSISRNKLVYTCGCSNVAKLRMIYEWFMKKKYEWFL